jgi:hypothetical protein
MFHQISPELMPAHVKLRQLPQHTGHAKDFA